MNLDQMLSLEGIRDYNIFWFGTDIASDYMNDEGPIVDTLQLSKSKPRSEDTVYIIMSGINKYRCRYRFASKLTLVEENTYSWKRIPIQLDEYASRMVFYRPSGFSFYNNDVTGVDFKLERIWEKDDARSMSRFNTYDDVELSFEELHEMVEGHYDDYHSALSSVKGIYMIIDGNTGKQYIGSAYSEEGIWGRWASYSATYHGGNLELIKLYEEHEKDYEDYFKKFKYIILQILPMRMSDKEVIEMESKYKKRFLTREFGMNAN